MYRFLILVFSVFSILTEIRATPVQKKYNLSREPIDVVIPSIERDRVTLELCIAGIKANCPQVRRVIVVSDHRLTDQAEWFDEAKYPFTKSDVAFLLCHKNLEQAQSFFKNSSHAVGWYYQQILKLYAAVVIPDISSNVLVLDSDTIFLNPVTFLDEDGGGLYNWGCGYDPVYQKHATRCLPELYQIYPEWSGICHHMLFQRAVLDDLFATAQKIHGIPFWQVFCLAYEEEGKPGASEYEIYFNFVFARTNQVHLRKLKSIDINNLEKLDYFRDQGYDYVSNHWYLRNTPNKTPRKIHGRRRR